MSPKKNIILTGELHCGKSTLVRRILEKLSVDCKGVFSESVLEHGHVAGYGLRLIGEPNLHIFAHTDFEKGQHFDKFVVDLAPFERAANYIEHNLAVQPDLFVVDEIGLIEHTVTPYKQAITNILDSTIPSVLVVQKRSDFLLELMPRHDVKIFVLETNHTQLEILMTQELSELLH